MTPLLTIYLCCWFAQTPPAPTPDKIRQAMVAALEAVKTAHVAYLDDEDNSLRPEETAMLKSKDPATARRWEINRTFVRDRVTLDVDAQAGVWRRSCQDLRDLDGIMAREGFGAGTRRWLDRSEVLLNSNSGPEGILHAGFFDEMDLGPKPSTSAVMNSQLPIGVVPDALFQRSSRTSVVAGGTREHPFFSVTLEWALHGETVKTVLEVDPKVGYRLRSMKDYKPDGTLASSVVLNDYRLVDGVYFPFHYEESQYDSTGKITVHRKITVQQARFNQKLAPDALQIVLPPGTLGSGIVREGRVGVDDLNASLGAHGVSGPQSPPAR